MVCARFLAALGGFVLLSGWARAQTTEPVAVDPVAVMEEFTRFAAAEFAPAKEPLVEHYAGKELRIDKDSHWQHVSENSAAIAWSTNLPSDGWVEYGPTAELGQRTASAARPFHIHLHHLKGLEAGREYFYQTVNRGADGTVVRGERQRVAPVKVAGAVYIGADTPLPVTLDRADTTYILTADLTADGSAIAIVAPNITLDLNGHTIVYDQKGGVKEDVDQRAFGFPATQGVQGIRMGYGARTSGRIVNGTVRQGAGGGGGIGNLPILARASEIAGVVLDYHGPQVSGVTHECRLVHHSVVVDRGVEVTNRHQGVDGLRVSGDVRYVRIERARQRGISAANGAKIEHNEIYVDSLVTNSFAVMFYKTAGGLAAGNRIYGTGYLAIGIGTVSDGVKNITVRDNLLVMVSTKPRTTSQEYGDQSGAYGLRVTWGGENILYEKNVVAARGRDGGMVRGIWFCPDKSVPSVVFRGNYVQALAENDASDLWGAVVVSGADSADVPAGLFEGNTIASNFVNLRLGEQYGAAHNALFIDNRIVRVGERANYRTIHAGFGQYNTSGIVLAGTRFEGGAAAEMIRVSPDGTASIGVGAMHAVKTAPGATVTVSEDGRVWHSATADAQGSARVALPVKIVGRVVEGERRLTVRAVSAEGVLIAERELVAGAVGDGAELDLRK